jgi:hypothetical protein
MCRAISKQVRSAWPSCIARAALGCRIPVGTPLCTNVLPEGNRVQQGCATLHAQQWRDQADPHTTPRFGTRQEPSEVQRWPRTQWIKTAAVPQVPRQVAATAWGTLYGFGVPQRSWFLALLFHRISL